jgi:hypothetical protein
MKFMIGNFSTPAPAWLEGFLHWLLLPAVLLAAGAVGFWAIGRWSLWYAKRLERGPAVSESGIVRLRRLDTRSRVLAAAGRAALAIALVIGFLQLAGGRAPSALLSAATLIAVLGFALQPIIRDAVAGATMMAERWFHVGDRIWVEPHQVGGVVEHFNLRSTQLRAMNGDRVVIHNASVWSVSIARRGVREMTLELIVRDRQRGAQIVEHVSRLLPSGPSQLVHPLTLVDSKRLGQLGESDLWRLVCRATVTPGRQWLLEDFAPRLFAEADSQLNADDPVILHGPLVYDDDKLAHQRVSKSVSLAQLGG